MSYAEVQSPALSDWIGGFDFKRIVVLDFGGRDNIVAYLVPSLHRTVPDKVVNVISVGLEMKIRTTERVRMSQQLQAPVFTTGGVCEAAIKQIGEKAYHEELQTEFETMLKTQIARQKAGEDVCEVLGMRLNQKLGMRGNNSLEKVWQKLSEGSIDGSTQS